MKALTKRQWTSWLRWSVLVFMAHATILGLIYDWNIFSCYQKEIVLFNNVTDTIWGLPQNLSFGNFYPKIFEALAIPIFSLVLLLVYTRTKTDKMGNLLGGIFVGTIVLGLFIGSTVSFDYGLMFGLNVQVIIGLLFGFVVENTFNLGKNPDERAVLLFSIGLSAGLIVGVLYNGFIVGIILGLAISIMLILYLRFAFVAFYVFKKMFSLKTWGSIFDWFMAKKIEN